jgi:hypothetical protein
MKTVFFLVSSAVFMIATAHPAVEDNAGTTRKQPPLATAENRQADVGRKGPWGYYTGTIRLELDPNGREMILVNEVRYTDRKGIVWVAPQGAKVDGASIPRMFWAVVGGPFEGKYRDASVYHDVACDQRRRPWQSTHNMFYEAMRCSGVSTKRAKLMYYAVLKFGPRWTEPVRGRPAPNIISSNAPAPTKSDIRQLQAWIEREDPSLNQLRQRATEGTY